VWTLFDVEKERKSSETLSRYDFWNSGTGSVRGTKRGDMETRLMSLGDSIYRTSLDGGRTCVKRKAVVES
jgi:hypothetical protein